MAKVFISYSHDSDAHRTRVRELSDRLIRNGVDCNIDQYLNGSPEQGWPLWMERQLDEADYVLVVCTETYLNRVQRKERPGTGKGVKWESLLTYQDIYDNDSLNSKFIPVIFSAADAAYVPKPLRAGTHYDLSPASGYEMLYRFLTGQPPVVKPSPGSRLHLPPENIGQDEINEFDAIKHSLQNLPFDSLAQLFKGRDDFIAQIQANLSAGSQQATAIVAKQAIHGLGGVGKTRLAVEYAWRCMEEYAACLYVTADSPENLERNLAELCGARVLDLPEKAAEEQALQVAATLRWLNQHPGWLLILDNVDTPEAATAVEQLLPALQNGHVLITSRRTGWGNSIRTLALDTLSEADAIAFLLDKTKERRTTTDDDAAAARKLARTMGGLALALEQAGAFVNTKHISLQAYQQRWEQQEVKLRHWVDEQVMHYPRSLAVTWETSFEQLTPAAQSLLNRLCWFAPEPIPRETFEAAFSAQPMTSLMAYTGPEDPGATQPVLEDLLAELESLSLMKWGRGNHSFSIHRLIQEITQTRLDDDTRRQSLMDAVGLINHALPSDPPSSDVRAWPVWDPLRPHIEHLIHAADGAEIADPTTRLMNKLGEYLLDTGERRVNCLSPAAVQINSIPKSNTKKFLKYSSLIIGSLIVILSSIWFIDYQNVNIIRDGEKIKKSVWPLFLPAKYIPNRENISFTDNHKVNCYKKNSCIKIGFDAANSPDGFGGIYWYANGSEDGPGFDIYEHLGVDEDTPIRISFRARGKEGGEVIKFKVGGVNKANDSIEFPKETKWITLTQKWMPYEINLVGVDLSNVVGGFYWETNSEQNPDREKIWIFLEDIRYEVSDDIN